MNSDSKKSSSQQPPTQPPAQQPTALTSSAPTSTAVQPNFRLPSDTTLQNASRLAVSEDKPIMMDYWTDSLERKALIGVREASNEKMLVKSAEEYTSPISKLYRSGTEFIVVTENSIYLVSSDIPTRKIS